MSSRTYTLLPYTTFFRSAAGFGLDRLAGIQGDAQHRREVALDDVVDLVGGHGILRIASPKMSGSGHLAQDRDQRDGGEDGHQRRPTQPTATDRHPHPPR